MEIFFSAVHTHFEGYRNIIKLFCAFPSLTQVCLVSEWLTCGNVYVVFTVSLPSLIAVFTDPTEVENRLVLSGDLFIISYSWLLHFISEIQQAFSYRYSHHLWKAFCEVRKKNAQQATEKLKHNSNNICMVFHGYNMWCIHHLTTLWGKYNYPHFSGKGIET